MYAKEVVIIGCKEEEDTVIRGDQIHSPEALYPMEGTYHVEILDLLQRLFAEISTSS